MSSSGRQKRAEKFSCLWPFGSFVIINSTIAPVLYTLTITTATITTTIITAATVTITTITTRIIDQKWVPILADFRVRVVFPRGRSNHTPFVTSTKPARTEQLPAGHNYQCAVVSQKKVDCLRCVTSGEYKVVAQKRKMN